MSMIGVAYAKELGAWIARSFYAPERFEQSVSIDSGVVAKKLMLLVRPISTLLWWPSRPFIS